MYTLDSEVNFVLKNKEIKIKTASKNKRTIFLFSLERDNIFLTKRVLLHVLKWQQRSVSFQS